MSPNTFGLFLRDFFSSQLPSVYNFPFYFEALTLCVSQVFHFLSLVAALVYLPQCISPEFNDPCLPHVFSLCAHVPSCQFVCWCLLFSSMVCFSWFVSLSFSLLLHRPACFSPSWIIGFFFVIFFSLAACHHPAFRDCMRDFLLNWIHLSSLPAFSVCIWVQPLTNKII